MTRLRGNVRDNRASVVAVLVAVAGLGAPAAAAAQMQVASATTGTTTGEAPQVTYAKDIAPLLQQNCQVCHQAGSIGPMSLMTYDEVRPWAAMIKAQVEDRAMPPYHYDTNVGIQQLKSDRRLTESQIETIVAWVDAGAPMGNLADMPPPVRWPDASVFQLAGQLGAPDMIVRSDPYDVPAGGQDVWWTTDSDLGLSKDRCIKAIEVKPSIAARSGLHHVVNTLRVTRTDQPQAGAPGAGGGGGGGGGGGSSNLTEYAIGKQGETVPSDVCRTLAAGSVVNWQIHYQPQGAPILGDVVEMALWFYPEDHKFQYKQTLGQYGLSEGGSGTLAIPPGGKIMMQGTFTWNTPVRIDSWMPHMHLRGTAMLMEMYDPRTRRRTTLSRVSNWNPGWQINHVYEDNVAPLVVPGQQIILTAWYDNSAENPHNPDPTQWVSRGARTVDEMSKAWIGVTALDQAGYDRLLAERQRFTQAPGTQTPARNDD